MLGQQNGCFQKNNGTPKSSILIGFSIINHPFWGPTPVFGNTQIEQWKYPLSIPSAPNARWWQLKYVLFSPLPEEMIPILTVRIFLRWVETQPPTSFEVLRPWQPAQNCTLRKVEGSTRSNHYLGFVRKNSRIEENTCKQRIIPGRTDTWLITMVSKSPK